MSVSFVVVFQRNSSAKPSSAICLISVEADPPSRSAKKPSLVARVIQSEPVDAFSSGVVRVIGAKFITWHTEWLNTELDNSPVENIFNTSRGFSGD